MSGKGKKDEASIVVHFSTLSEVVIVMAFWLLVAEKNGR
jgi:hypothetical protein